MGMVKLLGPMATLLGALLSVLVAALLGVLVAALPATSEEWVASLSPNPSSSAQLMARSSPSSPPKPEVDERALRYYALNNQHDRVEAEARRLRALYPGWTAPADLYAPGNGPNGLPEQALWDLYGQDNLSALDAEIAQRQLAYPNWQPSQELMAKIAEKRLRLAILSASDAADWGQVLAKTGDLEPWFERRDLEVIWRAAEALAQTGADDQALQLYQKVLAMEASDQERLASVQKALGLLGSAAAERLLAEGRLLDRGDPEFAVISDDILRAKFAEASQPGEEIELSDKDVTAISALAEKSAKSDDTALLAWYLYGQKRFSDAARWFQRGLGQSGSGRQKASLVEGYALSLYHLGEYQAMTDFIEPWLAKDKSYRARLLPLIASLLVSEPDYVVSAGARAAIAEALKSDGTAAQKEAFAWYLFTQDKPQDAALWFQASFAEEPLEVRARALVLAHAKSGDLVAAKAALQTHVKAYPALEDVALELMGTPSRPAGSGGAITTAYRQKDYARCLQIAKEREAKGALSARGKLIAAWCLHDGGEPAQAVAVFSELVGEPDPIGADATYGKALAFLKSGLFDQANRLALSGQLSAERRREVRMAALADAAVAGFAQKRYRDVIALLNQRLQLTPESRDLSLLRGWSLYHRGHFAAAEGLFRYLHQSQPNRHTRAAVITLRDRRSRR